jgi:hypothetical protein
MVIAFIQVIQKILTILIQTKMLFSASSAFLRLSVIQKAFLSLPPAFIPVILKILTILIQTKSIITFTRK